MVTVPYCCYYCFCCYYYQILPLFICRTRRLTISPLRTPEIYLILGDPLGLWAQTWPSQLQNVGHHFTSLTERLFRPWREILHSVLEVKCPNFAQEWQIIFPKSASPVKMNATLAYYHAPVTDFDSLSYMVA